MLCKLIVDTSCISFWSNVVTELIDKALSTPCQTVICYLIKNDLSCTLNTDQ